MVSTDHFRYELTLQLRRAAAQGAVDVLITSGELCESIRMGQRTAHNCCEAMQAEMKPGDLLVKHTGVDMTVRYMLPRN